MTTKSTKNAAKAAAKQFFCWDVERIFKLLGGPAGVRKTLAGPRQPALAAVRAWRSRRSIPASWLAMLLAALNKERGTAADSFLVSQKQIVCSDNATANEVDDLF